MSAAQPEYPSASDSQTDPPYSLEQVVLSEWPGEVKVAWQVFHTAELGDDVIWGDRKMALEVAGVETTADGFRDITVRGPQGGKYTLHERYNDEGYPSFYADDSRAMDLRYKNRSNEIHHELTESQYERILNDLTRASVRAYVEQDYATYEGAVTDVVNGFISDVEFETWTGWPYEWEDGDTTTIYRGILEHSGELPEVDEPGSAGGTATTPKNQATVVLQNVVGARGKDMAANELIRDESDYNAVVEELANDAVERDRLKANLDAREATRSVVEEFVDQSPDGIHRAIIHNSDTDPMDLEFYSDLDEADMSREMALDILDEDVWVRAKEIHSEEGTHDPTVRGLAFWEYDQLVETLVEETLHEHRTNDNRMLYSTARDVVQQFANTVERHEWPYEVGGVSEETWGAGDEEDIFTSIVMHSEVDPVVFNPFARDKERKMAAQVLSEVIHNRASNALDEQELREAAPVPIDDYLKNELGTDLTYDDIRDDTGVTPEHYIRETIENFSEEEVENLAGWTFVDELVEEGGASIPMAAGPWVLVDYGLVKRNDRERQLAWFNRNDGSVLILAGQTTNPPEQGGFGYENFHVMRMEWNTNEPQYLVADAELPYAVNFVRELVGSDSADVNVIETSDGKKYIQEAITEDDIDSRMFSGGIAPSFTMPGPDFSVDDVVAYGGEQFKRLGRYLQQNSRVVDALTQTAVMLFLGEVAYIIHRAAPGLNVEPDFHQKYGAGLKASYNFGQSSQDLDEYDRNDPDSDFYTGRLEGTFRITPGAFRFIADTGTPNWLYHKDEGTVLGSIQRRVEQPIKDRTGDLGQRPLASFIGAHLPTKPMGLPDKGQRPFEDREGFILDRDTPIGQNYKLGTGDVLSQEGYRADGSLPSLASYLKRATIHGFTMPKNRHDEDSASVWEYEGDPDVRSRLGVSRDRDSMLSPYEVMELAYSMKRTHVLGPATTRVVGTIEEVTDSGETEGDAESGEAGNPANKTIKMTYRVFREIAREFPYIPNNGMLDTVWEFYKARAREQEGFTLIDAFDRYRMGLVYDTVDRAQARATREVIQAAAKGVEWEEDDGSLDQLSLARVMQSPKTRYGGRVYFWNVRGALSAPQTFNEGRMDAIPPWIVFPSDSRPKSTIDHYWYNEDTKTFMHHDTSGDDDTDTEAPDSMFNDLNRYNLATGRDVFNALNRDVQNVIAREVNKEADIVVEAEEFDPNNPVPEEDRKWIQSDEEERIRKVASGSVRWDELDGTDLSVFGLFIRGMDMEAAADMADRWNLSDRFKTRLSDALPSNFQPSRPDIPSFEDWLDRRRGRNAIGSTTEKARAKAAYLREMADMIPGVQAGEAAGTDPTVEEEIEMMRDVLDHHEDTDYADYQQFYSHEFGESFEDVAQKFAAGRPVSQRNNDLTGVAPPGAQGTFTDAQTEAADEIKVEPDGDIEEVNEPETDS